MRLVPGFVIAFVGLAALRSLGDGLAGSASAFESQVWTPGLQVAGQVSELLLTIGMAAVGLTVEIGQLRRVGWRPLAAGLLSAVLLAAVSLTLVSALL